jgi:predicted ATPase
LNGKTFELNKLNVFSGYNGRGKSSVLQGLLMLSQSTGFGAGSLIKLHLNGNLISLGDFDEILTNDSDCNVEFNLITDDSQFENINLGYTLSEEDIKIGTIDKCIINDVDYFDTIGSLSPTSASDHPISRQFSKSIPEGLIKLLRNIHYISANRVGPVKYVEKKEVPDTHKIDPQGLNVINTIASYGEQIPNSMNLDNSGSEIELKEALSQWMNYIMTGGAISLPDDKKSPVLSIEFDITNSNNTRTFSSYNVGFGYSYILAIVITALIAKKDSLVIIENPEAHLHGQAQSRLTELLARLASRGVQLFVETHSEHIINGFRKEMLKNNCALTNKDASIYFFDSDFSVKQLEIQPNGRIPNWPKGFFDQETFDLAEIMRLGAKVR